MPRVVTQVEAEAGVLEVPRLYTPLRVAQAIAALGGPGGAPDWGDIGGTLSDQTDLQSAFDAKSGTSHNHTGVYEPAGTAATAVTAHEAAGNPHPTYLTEAEADALYQAIGSGGGLTQPQVMARSLGT